LRKISLQLHYLRHRKYTRADRVTMPMALATMYLFPHYGPMNAELNDRRFDVT
jgi:hypothetical protein